MSWSKNIEITELIFIGVFILAYLIYYLKISRAAKVLKTSAGTFILKFTIRFFYFSFIIVALMGPSFGISETEAKSSGRDIYWALDLSESMNTDDVSPSRLEKLKLELSGLASQLKNDRVAIILFSDEAHWLSPLTFDMDVIKNYLSKLDTKMLEANGTNLVAPIDFLSLHLSETKSTNRNKILMVFTDAEDFGNLNQNNITQLKNLNIKPYFIGIGTENGGKLYENGVIKTDKNGYELYSSLNLNLIKQMSDWANTPFILINNDHNDLNQLVANIAEQNTQKVENRKLVVENNKYLYFLLIALVLIIFDVLITVNTLKI